MSDRYYLLRNNRETGPFSLDELLQQCLLPGDLLWAEGRSQNWTEPTDMPEVKKALPKGYSHTPETKPAAEHVSDIELAQRAEALRRRALASLYQQQTPVHLGKPRPEMASGPVYLREEDMVEIVQHKAEKNRSFLGEFTVFCALSALVVLGWRSGIFAHLIQVRPQQDAIATQLVSEGNNTAHALRAELIRMETASPMQGSSIIPDSLQHRDSFQALALASPVKHAGTAPKPPRIEPGDSAASVSKPAVTAGSEQTASANSAMPDVKKEASTASVSSEKNNPVAERKDEKPATKPVVKTEDTAQAQPQVKEEHLGLFRRIFGGKKKKKDEPTEAIVPANPGR